MRNGNCIQPGEIVLFGRHFISDEPGEWIVLRTDGPEDTVLIAATESAGCVPYQKGRKGLVSWEDSFLRTWLNRIFYYYFIDTEKAAIHECDTPVSEDGTKTVRDRVFILSEAEASQLLKDREERVLRCCPEYNYTWHRATDWHDSVGWWLRADAVRSEKGNGPEIPVCSADGEFGIRRETSSEVTGVRPCMWVDRRALQKKPLSAVRRLGAVLVEKGREKMRVNDFGEERVRDVLAEFVDSETNESYVIFRDNRGPAAARVMLDFDISPAAEKKAEAIAEMLSRRPYREVMAKTQFGADERKVLEFLSQKALMPTKERVRQCWSAESRTRAPELDESGGYCVRMGRYAGRDLYWRILRNNGDTAYCLCETGILSETFMDEEGPIEGCYWENSMLREWLNGEFLQEAFSESEKRHLITVRTEKDTLHSSGTHDTVFLMSAAEVSCLLPDPGERLLSGTPDDVSLTGKICMDSDLTGDWWWLRTGGLEEDCFCCVSPSGEIDRQGAWGHSEVCAVRPAVMVDLYDSDFPIIRRSDMDKGRNV